MSRKSWLNSLAIALIPLRYRRSFLYGILKGVARARLSLRNRGYVVEFTPDEDTFAHIHRTGNPAHVGDRDDNS